MKFNNRIQASALQRLLLAGILLALAASCIGCSNNNTSCEYTTFILEENNPRLSNEGHALFSFEYPQCFNEVPLSDVWGFEGITDISFTREGTGRYKNGNFLRIGVTVHRAGMFGDTDANATIENVIFDVSTDENIEDLLILDRSSINIAGLTAEHIHYSFHNSRFQYAYPYDNRVKLACFVYDGLLWKIEFIYGPEYDEERQEEVEAWFDHLVETFEILD